MKCNVCEAGLGQPIYESVQSLTSLCDVYPEMTRVRICQSCGHLQSDSIQNIEAFYEHEYTILSDSEEEDQIYEVRNGMPVYRTEHQLNTILDKITLSPGTKVLDYGCAKSSMMRVLHKKCDGLDPHLYDVSDRYITFWKRFIEPEKWATYDIPKDWSGRFDVVTSFFSLEHIATPAETMTSVNGLLKSGGIFYAIVPNVFTNIVDFLVIDHVNHFTKASLEYMLRNAGFAVREIDDTCHNGAFIIVAEKVAEAKQIEVNRDEVQKAVSLSQKLAVYWTDMVAGIREFELGIAENNTVAIYGAGFYGAFILGCLSDAGKVVCLMDQNPYLCGREMRNAPIVSPADLPAEVDTVLVGLNPVHARNIISAITVLENRDINYFYL